MKQKYLLWLLIFIPFLLMGCQDKKTKELSQVEIPKSKFPKMKEREEEEEKGRFKMNSERTDLKALEETEEESEEDLMDEAGEQVETTTFSAPKAVKEGGFMFPESDKKVIPNEILRSLTKEELRIARNEIYARHGRRFKNRAMRDYFEKMEWYAELEKRDEIPEEELNTIEMENINRIKKIEQ